MVAIKEKVMKSRFAATYPIEKEVFLKERFYDMRKNNKNELLPTVVEVTDYSNDVTNLYTSEEGLSYLSTHSGDEIGLYKFDISPQNTIVERFYIRGKLIQLITNLETDEQVKEFYRVIFPMFGVLVFGEFDMNEEFLLRDDVCSAILHKVLKEYTILTGNWWCDYPNVNHYFVYSEYEKDNEHLTDVMALGGQPLEYCAEEISTTTAATFFLGKYINRKGNEVVITNSDDMKAVQEFEVDFIEMLTEALKASNVKHRIDYVAI